MKKIIIIVFITGYFSQLFGQTSADALRYSSQSVMGTARTVGVGGGIGALGADYSVLSTNPAGLAVYRSSEFVFTPAFHIASISSTLDGVDTETFQENKTKFSLNNLGIIFNTRPRGNNWKTFNIGIGLNRLADYNRTFFFQGETEGSYTDRFIELATDRNGNGLPPDQFDLFEASLAYNTGAIFDGDLNPDDDNYSWVNDFPLGSVVPKEQLVRTTGGMNELVFSMAGNYQEKLMIGLTIGVPFVNFQEEKTYKEENENGDIPVFNDLRFNEDLTTSGTGINLKMGMIYRVNQMVRLGAAVHTPTAFTLTDNFSTELEYSYDIERFNDASPDGTFEYKLKTPWRYIGSAGVIIKKAGFITAEIEWVDYSTSSFNLTANSNNPEDREYQEEVNDEIFEIFQSAVNFKIGGEYAYNKLRLRAGYGINGTPYAGDNIKNNSYSLGIGVREQNFYIDLAYRRTQTDDGYIPYRMDDLSKQQLVNNSINSDVYMLTLGFKF